MKDSQEHTPASKLSKVYISSKYRSTQFLIGAGLIFWILFVSFPAGGRIPPGQDNFKYDLAKPVDRYKLPKYLEEVSGLSYYGNGKIACVQDEQANIYVLDLEKEEIIDKHDFGDDADYEDIVIVKKTAYILRNNGTIYRVKDFKKKDRKVKKYPTELNEKNDAEGMAYDSQANALLIACKGSPSIGKENSYEGHRAIYKFDLEKKELETTPHFLIDLNQLDSYMDRSRFNKLSVKLAKSLRLMERETSFKPSGIAIHPLDGDIYIIASVGKLLIILNRDGKIRELKELDPELFLQPEGICFSPEGNLFISSEGKGEKGYILEFELMEQ
jgi:uncharacterized protein YjiK